MSYSVFCVWVSVLVESWVYIINLHQTFFRKTLRTTKTMCFFFCRWGVLLGRFLSGGVMDSTKTTGLFGPCSEGDFPLVWFLFFVLVPTAPFRTFRLKHWNNFRNMGFFLHGIFSKRNKKAPNLGHFLWGGGEQKTSDLLDGTNHDFTFIA